MKANPFVTDITPTCPAHLLEMAKQFAAMRTAIASAASPSSMSAAQDACALGILEPVFIGQSSEILALANSLNWDIANYQIVEAANEEECAKLCAELARNGEVGAVMKGDLHTDVFMKALVSSKTGIRKSGRLFHIFYITEPISGKSLILSDGAVNIAPDIATKKEILVGVDHVARALGISRPKIAMLSATETPIDAMGSSMEARELALWAADHLKTSDVSGPLALDLILSPKAVEIKNMQADPVAGRADAIIVPDIVSGNVLFKALVYLSGACAAGIVLGGKVPILLTSRADPPSARLASCALASIVANS